MRTKDRAYKQYRENKEVIQVFAPIGMRQQFKIACARNGITMKDVLLKRVYEYIKENK